MNKLPEKFFQRDTTRVARELLGKKLWSRLDGALTGGIIIETEAYLGVSDPACHTFGGRKTERVGSMYLEGGHGYVYLIYGLHNCFNVVTQTSSAPEAVLIRALLPTDGIDTMFKRRKLKKSELKNLCSGPGKLCQAMAIDRSLDGISLQSQKIWITEEVEFSQIEALIQVSPRVGVDYAGEAKNWPLRFRVVLSQSD